MAPAVVTNSTLATGFTQAQLTSAIQTALTSAGFGGFVSQAGSPTRLAGSLVVNAAATRSTAYLEVQITTAFAVTARISDNYNMGAFTATNQSGAGAAVTFVNTAGIAITAFNHPEMNVIAMLQGTTFLIAGIGRPANKPTWWDENVFLYAFNLWFDATGTVGLAHRLSALTANPHGYANTVALGCQTFCTNVPITISVFNAVTGLAPSLTPVMVGGVQGLSGSYSGDFQIGYTVNTAGFPSKYLQAPQEFTLLSNNATNAALAIRTL